jgi:hypothetical protein
MPDDVALEIIDLVHAGYDKISIIHGQPKKKLSTTSELAVG